MKRTKRWWSALTVAERSRLVWLERSQHSGGRTAHYPDDCSECGSCGSPALGIGLCNVCFSDMGMLLDKADAAVAGIGQ